MSDIQNPLQKYGQLLGRSIKIIECEVDPDAVIGIISRQHINSSQHKIESCSNVNNEVLNTNRDKYLAHNSPQGKNIKDDSIEPNDFSNEMKKLENEGLPNNASEQRDNENEVTAAISVFADDIPLSFDQGNLEGSSVDPANADSGTILSMAGSIACCTTGNLDSKKLDVVLNEQINDKGNKKDVIDTEPSSINTNIVMESNVNKNQNSIISEDLSVVNKQEAQNKISSATANQDDNMETDDIVIDPEFISVSTKVLITDYSQEEWKGVTYTAECMRMGYTKIINKTKCSFLRKIRGDNYCGLRATAFQFLTQNPNYFLSWKLIDDIVDIPEKLLVDYGCTWLKEWSFAGRIPVPGDNTITLLKECLSYLSEQIKISKSLPDYNSRDSHFSAVFNSGTNKELYLFEALKVIMLHEAVLLYEKQRNEQDIPIFAWLLFARDTCDSPENLMKNHLNSVGSSGGLEQVEMCLLGHALELTINVFRPSKSEEEDFISYYPEENIDIWDSCLLVAEDDRHYNIVTK